MQEENTKPLKIYSASAGSGKTYRLVQEYLKLILGDKKGYPKKNFAKVLAMTFTNKAAWEMKKRVIDALNALRLQRDKNLMKTTQETTHLSIDKIRERSDKVLSEILHNYEDFNLLTIDKFNLRLIRTFSRDLDLQEDVEVILDEKILLEQVIDELLSKIGQKNEDEITNLALIYAKRNAEDGNKWDFRQQLIKFSKVLTNEGSYKEVKQLLEQSYTEDKYISLQEKIKKLNDEHREKCNTVSTFFTNLGSQPSDYPEKSRAGGIFKKLSALPSRCLDDLKAPTKMIIETLDGTKIKPEHNVDPKLIHLMSDLLNWEAEKKGVYYTLKKEKANFYNNALLKYIAKELDAFKAEQNLLGIYEFGQRISGLLQKENTSFIYERLGSRYHHFLLDEFQDTSRLQWLNLIPLVYESISTLKGNLIVGDPKQAIYRFRNGLVEQFVKLPQLYNPENDPKLKALSPYFDQMGEKLPLTDNFRSREHIVRFNNAFFLQMLSKSPESFLELYADIKQNIKGKEGGIVYFQKFKEKDKEETKRIEEEFVLEKIKECLEDGHAPGDICLLIRDKKTGREIAKYLTENKYKVVSSDSLLVASDAAVRLCIEYLNLRKNSSNSSLQIKFAAAYFRIQGKKPISELQPFWIDEKVGKFDFSAFATTFFGSIDDLFFTYENLYDLGKQFLTRVQLSELNNIYLHHLMELFQEYDLKNGPDIRGFLENWETTLKKKVAVQMPENKSAIRIMTVHASKGLQFPIVILPNLTWGLNVFLGNHFVQSDDGSLLFTKLSHNNVPDYMLKAYNNEYEQRLLDEFNLLYVAFTRPVDRLYGNIQVHSPSGDYYTQMNQLISSALENWSPDDIFNGEESVSFIEKNSAPQQSSGEEKTTDFYPNNFEEFLWFPKLTLQDREGLEKEDLSKEQRFGTQLHLVFSKINATTEIENEVKELFRSGEIDEAFLQEIILISKNVVQKLQQQPYFQSAQEILHEQDIIIDEKEVKRPDIIFLSDNEIVVLDFKTGKPTQRDKKQVRNYCQNIAQMQLQNTSIKGYLFYTSSMEIEEVLFSVV